MTQNNPTLFPISNYKKAELLGQTVKDLDANRAFVLPAVLCCLLIAALSIGVLAPLLYRDRMRVAVRNTALRARVDAHNNAFTAAEKLRMANTLPPGYSQLEGSETRSGWRLIEALLLRNKFGDWPEHYPTWSVLESLPILASQTCKVWSQEIREDMFGISALNTCTSMPTLELEDYYLPGNLKTVEPIHVSRKKTGGGTIAVMGSIEISDLLLDAEDATTLVIVALGSIDIKKMEVPPSLTSLSVISLSGTVELGLRAHAWDLCFGTEFAFSTIPGVSASRPRLFVSSAIATEFADLALDGAGPIGCEPVLQAPIWQAFSTYGGLRR